MSETETYPKAEFIRKPNLSEYRVPKCGLNTRHDNREVALIHLTRAQTLRSDKMRHRLNPHEPVNDYQRYSMLIVSASQVYILPLSQSSSL